MVEKILDKASYSLMRTNPKLSGNVKLVSNGDKLYLESFSANTQLSSSRFKSFKISGDSTYNNDVHRFFQFGAFPKELAFSVYQQYNDISVLSSYAEQYEMFYSAGTKAMVSDSYKEKLGMLAPIWLNEQIPKYFVIFRIDDPAAVNNLNADNPNDNEIDAQTSKEFTKNVLENCTAIKTFDLSEESKLGSYIRRYRSQKDFPAAPLRVSWRKDEPIQWNGISYSSGGFTSNGKFLYEDLITNDTTIMNNEYLFTKGFEQNGVIAANLINMQFLFDDPTSELFSINRYFGLYVNDIEEGEFDLSGIGFYKGTEKTQTPKIETINQISEKLNTSLELQNPNGILLYLDENRSSSITGFPTPNRVNEVESIFYVKDKKDQFHTIKKGSLWKDNQIRLFDKKIDISLLTGYKQPDTFANATILQNRGRSMVSITVNGKIPTGVKIKFYDGNELTGQISADSNIATLPGNNVESFFNTEGTNEEVAKSLSKAINDGIDENKKYFTSYYNENTVYVISNFGGSKFNNLNVTLDWIEYPNMPIETYPITSENSPNTNFIGGSDKPKSSIRIEKGDQNRFTAGKFIRTNKGFTSIKNYIPYLEEPIRNDIGEVIGFRDIDKYIVIQLNDNDIFLTSTKQVSLYNEYKPSFGRFSYFPIKDFDFDFYSELYGNLGELEFEKEYYNQFTDATNTGVTGSESTLFGISSNPDIIDFYSNTGFATLIGLLKDADPDQSFDSVISSEYNRLEENYLTSQAVSSRVVPYINKWGYFKEGKDVRNNPYRLNVSEAFTLNNFAPSKYDFNRSPFGFSHEWYYLAKLPEYFSQEAIENSWSYFNDAPTDSLLPNPILNNPYIPGTFQDISKNYFDEYFIIDKISNSTSTGIIDKQLRYGTFNGGNSDNFAEAFLRGVKIIAKPKALKSADVNFNAKSISYVRDGRFNDYRFSAMLVPNIPDKPESQIKIIKNEKWKTVVMLISINLAYECINDNDQIIDRTSLYSLNSAYSTDSSCEPIKNGGQFEYENGNMQGSLSFTSSGVWSEDTSKVRIKGQPDINGIPTKFLSDIGIGIDGQYTDIQFQIGNDVYLIDGITRVLSDDILICSRVLKNGSTFILPAPGTPPEIVLRQTDYITIGGGFNKFRNILNSVSFASIAKSINQGDPNVIYETIQENGEPVLDSSDNFVQTFILNLRSQDDILKSVYAGVLPDPAKPTSFNLVNIIGYDLSLQRSPRITPIARHSGNYEPISRDIIFFKDPYLEYDFAGNTGDTWNLTGSTSGPIPDETYKFRVFELTRHANTQFNSSKVSDFGQIKNMFYHKVNIEDPSSVLELSNESAFRSLYPLINEVGINKRDFYIFSSNWEPGYFIKSLDKNTNEIIIGTRSMKEKKSFFGSKYIKTPDSITLEDFTPSDFFEPALNQPDLVNGDFMHKEDNIKIEIYLFIRKRLIEFLFEPIKNVFQNYINEEYSFGEEDTLNDDVKKYIEDNILSQYKIDVINLYTKRERLENPTDYQTAELSNSSKISAGLTVNENFSSKILNTNDFDTRLIYNKIAGFSESLGFSITLNKK